MSKLLEVDPEDPQTHLLRQAVKVLEADGVIVYPTDSGYALGCRIDAKSAVERIRRIRSLPNAHPMTLMCRDLSELVHFCPRFSDAVYKILKCYTPGPYTFLLNTIRGISKTIPHSDRKIIGIRIPKNTIAQSLLEAFNCPLLSSSLILPNYDGVLIEPGVIYDLVGSQVDLVLDGGFCGREPTSMIDLTTEKPVVVRIGKGDVSPFQP